MIETLKGSVVFTAEPRRTLSEMFFFSFPLRGRKAKIPNPTGYDDTLYLSMMLVRHSNAECFSFAVLSTANEKYSHSVVDPKNETVC